MPRLLSFAPCQRAVIDINDFSLSMTSLFCAINTAVPPGAPLPTDTAVQLPWWIGVYWAREPGDADREFEQRITLTRPDGVDVIQQIARFAFPGPAASLTHGVNGFPVGIEGEHTLSLAYRAVGEEEWHEAANYPITVIHNTQPQG